MSEARQARKSAQRDAQHRASGVPQAVGLLTPATPSGALGVAMNRPPPVGWTGAEQASTIAMAMLFVPFHDGQSIGDSTRFMAMTTPPV